MLLGFELNDMHLLGFEFNDEWCAHTFDIEMIANRGLPRVFVDFPNQMIENPRFSVQNKAFCLRFDILTIKWRASPFINRVVPN